MIMRHYTLSSWDSSQWYSLSCHSTQQALNFSNIQIYLLSGGATADKAVIVQFRVLVPSVHTIK